MTKCDFTNNPLNKTNFGVVSLGPSITVKKVSPTREIPRLHFFPACRLEGACCGVGTTGCFEAQTDCSVPIGRMNLKLDARVAPLRTHVRSTGSQTHNEKDFLRDRDRLQ